MVKVIEWIKRPKRPLYALVLYFDSVIPYGLPDKLIVKARFYQAMGYDLDLKHPISFNEKLNWLKLYDRNPLYTIMVDKVKVKDYVASIIGKEYVIPTIGVWDSPDDIDFVNLPNQFVLKCNHNSGIGLYICKDKNKVTQKMWENVKENLRKGLKENYYKRNREWPYKNVEKKIIAEKYLEDNSGNLNDYKVLCFSGKAKLIEFHTNRYTSCHTQDFYDIDWNKTDISQGGRNTMSEVVVPKPLTFNEMVVQSEILTKNMPHCRVDWYEVHGKMYFGELTFYDSSGLEKFDREDDERLLGSWIDLSISYNEKH